MADPLQALQTALTVPPDSKQQADVLATLRDTLEGQPGPIPVIVSTLIQTVRNGGDSILKRWVIDLLHFGLCRANLPIEVRTQLASQCLDTLAGLLHDPNPMTVKVVVQAFAAVYPLLFRYLITNRSNRQQWDVLSHAKGRILEFVWSPGVSAGVRLSALKFLQRVVLVQTRGIADPRLQNKNDPNLSMCPADHPFIHVMNLEAEGQRLFEHTLAMLFNSQNADIMSAILNSWPNLVKLRPLLAQNIIGAVCAWSPAALVGFPYNTVRSVEKSIRILLIHILRSPQGGPFSHQINDALTVQAARMERATLDEKNRKAAAAALSESRKRPPSSTLPTDPAATDANKRVKLDHDPSSTATLPASILSAFDFTTLPAPLITELIVANLQAFDERTLIGLVQNYRQAMASATPMAGPSTGVAPMAAPVAVPAGAPGASDISVVAPVAPAATVSTIGPPATAAPVPAPPAGSEPVQPADAPTEPVPPAQVKEEPVDPLQMDIDQDELEYEPDLLNQELEPMQEDDDAAALAALDTKALLALDFKIPPPRTLSEPERDAFVKSSVARIWDGKDELSVGGLEVAHGAGTGAGGVGPGANDLWMLLIVRMVTRVVDPNEGERSDDEGEGENSKKEEEEEERMVRLYERQDRLRRTLCDYVMKDFSGRIQLATTWMNEEWYNDQIRLQRDRNWPPNYDTWLNQIVATYQNTLDGKDRVFGRFLLDLPAVPPDVFTLLRDICLEPERMQVGFTTLREFVTQRPTLRVEAMNILLELTTHPEKVTRGAAIITVKRWIGEDMQPMDSMVRDFALGLLRRLQTRPPPEKRSDDPDENMEDGQLPQEEVLQTPYLPALEFPAQKSVVLQHVELLFVLSVKSSEFLAELFAAYGEMHISVQEAIQDLITVLVRSMGPTNGKLLTLMRTFPPGADTLALRVLNIFTEHSRPSSQLVALVKALMAERDLDPRFLIPIIAEMDKADIVRHLPKIVSMLNGTMEPKNLVRSVFGAIVTTPPQTFGSVTSNMPRVRQSELLTPAELMVLLHESEKEIGLKSAIEAIGICFSMTDVFRSEILAVVMQQIVDESVLPTLFLRTVIQAVTTYKSLVGFVSTTLLSRLITKKIWMNPPLWEGFIRCAKVIAPSSFGALLQLPKEQLRELVDKQPSLKAGLRDYVMKKAGNKARVAGYLDIFGEDDGGASAGALAGTPAPATSAGAGVANENGTSTPASAADGTATPPPPSETPAPASPTPS